MKFSLVIPVYKQEKTIVRDIKNILHILSDITMPFEIIIVVDGMLDGSFEEARTVKDPRVIVMGYKTNHGKGYAVRYGMGKAKGDIIGFMDAGGDLMPRALPLMLAQFEFQQADVVIGSKRHPDSKIKYPTYRKILSWGYQRFIRLLFGLNVRDTQVGMKIYKRMLLEDVMPRLLVKQFAFDIEILAVAYHFGYRRIYEAPIEIDFTDVKSTITWAKLLRTILNMLNDTLAVYYRMKIIHYYDNTNKRKWIFDPELNFRVNVG
jgi:glycosyltransferase involved in cell wall biosynthesis